MYLALYSPTKLNPLRYSHGRTGLATKLGLTIDESIECSVEEDGWVSCVAE